MLVLVEFVIFLGFIFKVFRKLKKEMLLSNKLLYIIDYEQIDENYRH